MFKWRKLGRVFNPTEVTDRHWLKEFAQAPCVLLFDTFIRVYFACRPNRDAQGQYVSYTGYLDLKRSNLMDILNISKNPILQLGKTGSFDEFGTYPTSVIRWNGSVWGYYAGWTRCESVPYNTAIGLAISHDEGETFTKVGKGPLLSYGIDEPMTISGPKIRRFNDRWYLWYISGTRWKVTDGRPESIFKIRMATSKDGLNWTRINRPLIEDRLDLDECQASPDVIFYEGKYHMFFCYKHGSNFRNTERGYRIGYASSDNLLDWVRDDSKAGIDLSEAGFDDASQAYPHVFELDDNLYMLYLGNEVGRYGFGLAQLQDYK